MVIGWGGTAIRSATTTVTTAKRNRTATEAVFSYTTCNGCSTMVIGVYPVNHTDLSLPQTCCRLLEEHAMSDSEARLKLESWLACISAGPTKSYCFLRQSEEVRCELRWD